MKIAIEALGIHYSGGGRSATLNLLEALATLDTENTYLVVLSEPEPSLNTPAGNIRQYIAPVKNRLVSRLWAQVSFPFLVKGYDVVHFAKNLGIFGLSIPTVVTVYDLTILRHPELYPHLDVWYWRYLEKWTLASASRIIAISTTTARDIELFYHIAPQHVRMIYPACARHFRVPTLTEIAAIRQRYGLPDQFLVHVGRIGRKKNLPTLVEAFADFRQRSGFEGALVLVGENYEKSLDQALHPTIDRFGLKSHVIFTGRVPDMDLPALYGGALACVFPSIHEGFGLVALEAMACGTPLIAHAAGAVAEVTGDAALILRSNTREEIAAALTTVFQDAQLRLKLRQRGLARAQCFDWQTTARQTLQLYREVIRQ